MTNILLNINNFGEPFAKRTLRRFIRRGSKVLIIPLSYHEDYINTAEDYTREFSKGSSEIEDIIKEFAKFGVSRKNVRILHYYNDSPDTLNNKFQWADILFFTGGYPDRALYRIDTLGIRENIVNFKGVVIGTSAGAMIQFDEYHVTPEDEDGEYEYHINGLGLVSGFDIDVHYEDDVLHLNGLKTYLQTQNKPIYAMPNDSGLLIHRGNIIPLGDVLEFSKDDINAIDFVLEEIEG